MTTPLTPHDPTPLSLMDRLSQDTTGEVLAEVWARYESVLRGFALRQALTPDERDDLLQETFLGLRQAMPSWQYSKRKGSFRGYLYTAIRNGAIRLKDQASKRPIQLKSQAALEAIAHAPEQQTMFYKEWQLHHFREASRIVAASFPENYLIAFYDRFLDGLPVEATMAKTGMSKVAVYKARSRVMKRFSAIVRKQIREEG